MRKGKNIDRTASIVDILEQWFSTCGTRIHNGDYKKTSHGVSKTEEIILFRDKH
jgi:hypothetical protein